MDIINVLTFFSFKLDCWSVIGYDCVIYLFFC